MDTSNRNLSGKGTGIVIKIWFYRYFQAILFCQVVVVCCVYYYNNNRLKSLYTNEAWRQLFSPKFNQTRRSYIHKKCKKKYVQTIIEYIKLSFYKEVYRQNGARHETNDIYLIIRKKSFQMFFCIIIIDVMP